MIEIIVVRHGQSVADIEDRHEGRADFPLTYLGREQAQKAAQWIKENYQLEIIYSSTLKRAAETAEIINSKMNVEITYEPDLMEYNNGVLAGLLRTEAAIKYPLPLGGRKPHEAIEGGESEIQFRARGEHIISKVIHDATSRGLKQICIVSHGGMINMMFRSFLNLSIHTNAAIFTGDTGIHVWRITKDERRAIILANSQIHLT